MTAASQLLQHHHLSLSDDIVSTPFLGRKPAGTSNKATPKPCTGPVLVALPAPPPGKTDLVQHIKGTLKVNVSCCRLNVSELHVMCKGLYFFYLSNLFVHFLHKVTKCTETIGTGAQRVTCMECPKTLPRPEDDKMEQEECVEAVGSTSSKTHTLSGVKVKGLSNKD